MARHAIMVTGFEPFGGEDSNSSGEVARAIDGATIASYRVVGRILPVDLEVVPPQLDSLVREIDPAVILNLGLAPGEPVIRLERIAVNVADFEIPDNTGRVVRDASVHQSGPIALASRLPLRRIERALLDAGIPARISNTAGLFLCNVAMYTALQSYPDIPAGFVHLPYLPKDVAGLLRHAEEERGLRSRRPASQPSMSLSMMVDAIRIILEATVSASLGDRRRQAGFQS